MISTWKIVWVSILANLAFAIVVTLVLGTVAYKMMGGQAGILKLQDIVAKKMERETQG
jgi:hypothetical protein